MKITIDLTNELWEHLKHAPDKSEVVLTAIASMQAISESVAKFELSEDVESLIEDIEDIAAGYTAILGNDETNQKDGKSNT